MARVLQLILRGIFALVFVLGRIASATDAWYNDAFALRRTLTVGDAGRGGKLRAVAYASVPTLGKCKSDGSDLRVVDDSGKEMKVRVISAGFDDKALIAFEAPKKGAYKLYFANPTVKDPAKTFDPNAGIVLEVRELGAGAPDSWEDVQKMIQDSPKIVGRTIWPDLEVNFNPFGSWEKGIYVQSGTLDIPADGTYGFQSNAFAASFILIDGKLVVDWPGWHNAKINKRKFNQGQLDLKAGAHSIEYVNVFNAHGACLAGWQKPGDKGFTPIPGNAFAGYAVAQIGPAESKRGPVADFDWQINDDLGMEGRAVTSVQFSALGKGKVYKWDFGDGVIALIEAPLHVYIEPGVYTVKCETDGIAVTQHVSVRPTHGHRGKQYEKRIAEYAAILQDYPLAGFSDSACFELALICHEAERYVPAANAFRAAFEKGYMPRNADEFQWLMRLYDFYRDHARFDDALWVCDDLLKITHNEMAAMAMNMKAEIQYDYMDNAALATETCKAVLLKFSQTNTDHVRMAYIRMGEYAMVRGDRALARKTLDEAQKADKWKKWTGDIEVTEGSHELNFYQYLRQREFEAAMKEIVSWEWQTPTVKLSGQTRYMRGRLYVARKMFDQALKEFDRAAQADKQAPFTDEILFYKAAAYEGLKDAAKARECYAKLAKDFPESKLAAAIREKLK